jgi:hypothetical protein
MLSGESRRRPPAKASLPFNWARTTAKITSCRPPVERVTPDGLQINTHQDDPEAAQALKEGKIHAFALVPTLSLDRNAVPAARVVADVG